MFLTRVATRFPTDSHLHQKKFLQMHGEFRHYILKNWPKGGSDLPDVFHQFCATSGFILSYNLYVGETERKQFGDLMGCSHQETKELDVSKEESVL